MPNKEDAGKAILALNGRDLKAAPDGQRSAATELIAHIFPPGEGDRGPSARPGRENQAEITSAGVDIDPGEWKRQETTEGKRKIEKKNAS
jgi:hypothetical protein